MRKTVKYLAGLKTLKALPSGNGRTQPDHDELYAMLEHQNYYWDSKRGQWEKFTTPPNARKTGVVDIRMRAAIGDVERAALVIGTALEASGLKIVNMSVPYPDNRHGTPTTARVYFQWILPEA